MLYGHIVSSTNSDLPVEWIRETMETMLFSFLFHLLLSTRFPGASLSTSHVRADWLHYLSSAAKWA